MRCDEIMKRNVECISPDETAASAAQRMRDENVGFLPVCQQGRVLGTLTDRDIAVRLVAANQPPSTRVTDIMSREAVYCRPQDDIKVAQRLMAENHKSRIMVVDENGKLVGVISLSDIAQHDRSGQASETLRGVSSREARA